MDGMDSRERVLAVMAHDIKAPLAGVIDILDVVARDYITDVEKIKEMVSRAARKTGGIINMVNDILDYSLLQEKANMKRERVHLGDVLCESIDTMNPFMVERRILLSTPPALAEGSYVDGNYTFLLRAFNNILMNAVKYNKDKGKITVRSSEDAKKRNMTLIFSDTGIGIPPDEVDNVFKLFQRGRFARRNIDGSLGLGLSLVKQIIDDHDGDICLNSTQGVGTTITLVLPLLPPRPESVAEEEEQ